MLYLKIISALLGLIGSIIIAYRVVGILNALALAANVNELNIAQLMSNDGISQMTHLDNATQHIENAQRTYLLIAGFGCMILSTAIQLFVLIC